jgi:hypothetical protein
VEKVGKVVRVVEEALGVQVGEEMVGMVGIVKEGGWVEEVGRGLPLHSVDKG